MFIVTVLLFSGFLAICPPIQTNDDVKGSAAATITIAELRDHMYFLASDFLGGRVMGTEGYDIAAEYGATQFRNAGLKTMVKNEDGKDTFLQAAPYLKIMVNVDKPLKLMTATGEKEIPAEMVKFVALGDVEAFNEPLPLVFVGYAIEEPDHGWNDFEGLDLEGKMAVMLMGAPTKDDKPVLPEEVHKKYVGMPGSQVKVRTVLGKKPSALLVIADKQLEALWNVIPSSIGRPTYEYLGEEGSDSGPSGSPNAAIIKGDFGKPLFEGQEYDPFASETIDLDSYKTFDLKNASLQFSAEVCEEKLTSPNVVGLVPGTDPELSNQYIVVTAHLDHIPPVNDQVCNGADDNASGCIGVIEIAEAMALNPPKRSVIFCLFTGEDVPGGFIGSVHFLTDCPVPLSEIMVNLNLDMIGRSDKESQENRAEYVMDIDKVPSELKDVIITVNERTVNWPLIFKDSEQGASDHFAFHRKGIPAAAFWSGLHSDLHRPTDDAEKIDFEKMQKIAQLAYEITMELANRDAPLKAEK